nr:hypothetical protein Cbor_146 [Cedratvirus borely]
MHYEFFTGRFDLEKVYPGLEDRSVYEYTEPKTLFYVIYRGREIPVLQREEGWYPVERNGKVQRYLSQSKPEILSREKTVSYVWDVDVYLERDNEWLSLLMHEDKVIGYYKGIFLVDKRGKRFSTNSFITISPEYQGRGLCKGLASFTYERLVNILSIDYIVITISSSIGAGACRCYIRAAKDLGLYTFGSFSYTSGYSLRDVNDCNLQGLDYLIFSVEPSVDRVVTERTGYGGL